MPGRREANREAIDRTPSWYMRLLHCADLHGNDRWFDWLIKESPRFDLVCIAGDLLDVSPCRPIGDQLEMVPAYLRKVMVPLAICSGNHDCLAGGGARLEHAAWLQELRGPGVWVDGDQFELGGFGFRCIPWMSQELVAGVEEIWVVHSPPDQTRTGIVRGGADFGDFALGELCRSGLGPRLALSGHVHDPQAWHARVGRTWSLNPGYQERGNVPRHIEVELDRSRAFWHGGNDTEDRALLK